MDFRLEIAGAPESVPSGTGILLLHPSTAETDRVDTQFLSSDTDRYVVISTRTTAREVDQKLDFYDIDRSRAVIIDAISVERGYSRRQSDRVDYLTAPDDMNSLIETVDDVFDSIDEPIRLSLDSVTELTYYAGFERSMSAISSILTLLREHDAIGIFHLATGVHDDGIVDEFRGLFDLVIELSEDGSVSVSESGE